MKKPRIAILGAAGRDFHNFNTVYRDRDDVEVVCFTATQIPDIAGRKYPASLAGLYYPNGIDILDEADLVNIIKELKIDECVLSYSDLPYSTVMHLGSTVMANGAKFSMLGTKDTMLKSSKPVIAVVAVRTGCGKSQTSRRVVEILKEAGKRVVSVRHPMPYGDLEAQRVQRYASLDDLVKNKCTIEEMEEYEPHIAMGSIIYAGVDYEEILKQAEKEADVIIWDGGNNDFSFYKPDLTITVVDPFRPGHEIGYYPGEVNLKLADIIVINKTNSAPSQNIDIVFNNSRLNNPQAKIIKAKSDLTVDDPSVIKDKRVLIIEDGPTLTHGEMKTGAGTEAAKLNGAREFVDPRPFVVGKMKETFEHYPNIGILLPAMGYGEEQMKDLEETINRVDCEGVVIGTPIDLARFIKINKPSTRVKYDLDLDSKEQIAGVLREKGLV